MASIKYLAGDGKTEIEIRVRRLINSVCVVTYINGIYDNEQSELRKEVNNQMPGVVASVGRIVLRQDRADEVQAMIDALQAEIDACPVAQMARLTETRQSLSSDLIYILDAAHEAHYNAVEQMSANGFAKRNARDFEFEEKSARAALADFDAAHPDVVAAIKAIADKQTQSFLNTN